ncbi:efflux RND transporter periplasmic adaptor subunit [Ectothiorhodospira marina]|jgi:RND family efflux transporter MFP subunit|uniref:RND family efflux transporter, MFP subunit n=1 Tax=Ectothiorhodospira marina TaxID=1396821 RepID=A0A1H7KVQ5_9GAMM|nr:efflux RND transporter periplasmic adaptor subunit [Ectothiorhodospira marina]SEK90879.1 RND family efflux transporter, MFP subunit [Ectothiorhodospira marina]
MAQAMVAAVEPVVIFLEKNKEYYFWVFGCLMLLSQTALANVPGVELARVEKSEVIEEVRLNGTVNALRTSALSTLVPGQVDEVMVEVGDRVHQGDPLIRLDSELAQLTLESARAETREARARLAEARRRLEEAERVGAGGHIARTEIGTRESEVATAEATVARLQAAERREQAVVRYHRIDAPFDGVVTERYSDLGEWVDPGSELLQLVDTENLRLDFRVPQEFHGRLDERTMLEVWLRGRAQEALQAEIRTVVPVNDAQARTFLIRAARPEGRDLPPGTALSGLLRIRQGEEGLSIPRDAINRYPEGRTTVWVAEQDDGDKGHYRVTEQRVRLGVSYDERVVVTNGLKEGQWVVSRGNEVLEEGMRVRLSEREGN